MLYFTTRQIESSNDLSRTQTTLFQTQQLATTTTTMISVGADRRQLIWLPLEPALAFASFVDINFIHTHTPNIPGSKKAQAAETCDGHSRLGRTSDAAAAFS